MPIPTAPPLPTQDINVARLVPLPTPRDLRLRFEATPSTLEQVAWHREKIAQALTGVLGRVMVILGPCAMRSYAEVIEVAKWIAEMQERFPNLFLVMRLCPDKPRTTIGWTGICEDPDLDGTCDLVKGKIETRRIFAEVASMGVPISMEVLGAFTIHYVSDVVSYGWIGARSVQDPGHRRLASALSMPVGFKNGDGGNLEVAYQAIQTASFPHMFRGIDDNGQLAQVTGKGNMLGHLILRGGAAPNYDRNSVATAIADLKKRKLLQGIVIDASHGNSLDPATSPMQKRPERQRDVALDVTSQIVAGRSQGQHYIAGMMLEVDLETGKQDPPKKGEVPKYGISITDACLGIGPTTQLLEEMSVMLA